MQTIQAIDITQYQYDQGALGGLSRFLKDSARAPARVVILSKNRFNPPNPPNSQSSLDSAA